MSVDPASRVPAMRYCLQCLHPLEPSGAARCQECGRPFIPTDPSTTAESPNAARMARTLRRTTVTLTWIATVSALGTFTWSFLGGSPILVLMAGIPLVPVLLLVSVLSSIPSIRVRRRTRIMAFTVVVFLLSQSPLLLALLPDRQLRNELLCWPTRLSFHLHRNGIERIARTAEGMSDAALRGWSPATGVLGIERISRSGPAGSLGLQLSGGKGGGIFVVRRTGTNTGGTVWWNTNFEIRLADGWWLVEQD